MAYDGRDYTRGSGGGAPGGGGGREFWYRVLRMLNASFPIGTYLDTQVRVHILFVLLPLFFVGTFSNLPAAAQWTYTGYFTAAMFLAVLLHEFGHVLACRAVGGRADHILMWPLGGLAFCQPPRRWTADFITTACGPLVSLVLAGAGYAALVLLHDTDLVSLNPLHPTVTYVPGPRGMLIAVFAVNYALLLFNLALVFYPFDGGRMVQAVLWKFIGYQRSMTWACRLGMVGAVALALYALSNGFDLLLLSIAAMGFFASYQMGRMLRMEGAVMFDGGGETGWHEGLYDPQYQAAMDRQQQRVGWLTRWRQQRQARRTQRRHDAAAQLEKQVDDILDKVRREGIAHLSAHEKRILQQATQRQRRGD